MGFSAGYSRHRADFYLANERPKKLWLHPLTREARQQLRAVELPEPCRAGLCPAPSGTLPVNAGQGDSLLAVLRQAPDPRDDNTRYRIGPVLTLIALALLAGRREIAGMARFATTLTQAQRRRLGLPLKKGTRPGPATQGAYRFFENDDIDAEAIRDAHQQATLERVCAHPVVLALQDTSTLNYTTHPQTRGLGPVGTRRQKILGLLLHSTLAVTPSGRPLGMLHTAVAARDPKAAGRARQRHTRPTAEKESQKWLDSLSACQQVAPQCPATLLVNVADREGDLYDLFAQALVPTGEPRVPLLVRSRHDRRLAGEDRRLWDAVGQQRSCGPLQVRVGRRGEQPARLATLSIRFARVTLAAPTRQAGQPPLTVWAIEARELHPPTGAAPILWRLLTTLPVTSVAEACEKAGWYAQRWQIEVLHKVLKSGCRIEQRQLETAARLERVLAVDQVVAWRLLALCKAAREQPDAAVGAWLARAEWEALWCHVHQRTTPPQTPPGVRQAVRWIAQLGGFLARKGDGEPGPLTLWRGLHRLNDLSAMWRLFHGIKPKSKRCAQ